MGLNFRKRIKFFNGVHINLSKSGASGSIGGKGVTANVSKRGVKTTLGVEGTGVSYATSTYKSLPRKSSATIQKDNNERKHMVALEAANFSCNSITLGNNERNEFCLVLTTNKYNHYVSLKDLRDIEVVSEDTVEQRKSLFGAAVGGFIFGGAGMITGAVISKNKKLNYTTITTSTDDGKKMMLTFDAPTYKVFNQMKTMYDFHAGGSINLDAELEAKLQPLLDTQPAPAPLAEIESSSVPIKNPVGGLLGFGIFVCPLVFAWFTLKKGRSTTSKILAFGWMLILFSLVSKR